MIDEVMSYVQDIWGRLSRLESKSANYIQVYATTTASKNLNLNTGTVIISWNNSETNVGTLFSHSTVTNDTRITVNRKAKIFLAFHVVTDSATANVQLLYQLRVNGATVLRPFAYDVNVSAGGSTNGSACITRVIECNAGDYIEVRCILSGAAGTVTLAGTGSTIAAYEIFQ